MTTIFKYTMIIMLIALAIGFANMYPIVKYTALIAFISFIIYKIKKYKSKPSKEEMARLEAEYEAEYEAKLRENDPPVITKEELKKAEETMQKFLNGFRDLERGLVKYINVEGGSNEFCLITYGGAKYFVAYDPDIGQHTIRGISQNNDMSQFAKAEMSYGDAFIKYDGHTNTLYVF